MSGLDDEVVTRCASCGYALTARRHAAPHDCPICRAPLDPETARPSRDAAQAQTGQQPLQAATPDAATAGASEAATSNASESEGSSSSSTPGESAARGAQASPPSFGEVTEVTPPAAVTSPLGSVTMPMHGPGARGAARESERGGAQAGARQTVAYTPLDAGELWSEFGGAAASRPEPEPQSEAKPGAEPEPEGAPPPPPPSPPTPQPPASFPQSSPLGLSGASRAQASGPNAAPPPFAPPPAAPAHEAPARGTFEAGVAPKVMSRYKDGYRAARVTVALGTAIKVSGALLGLLVGFGLFAVAYFLGQGPRGGVLELLLGLFFGGAAFALFFVLGVLVSSFGELKKAALDSAVNSSPFLTNEQRAEVMSLR